ncbi:rhomboid family intramembrane serine protease [Aquipseudomonas campi]
MKTWVVPRLQILGGIAALMVLVQMINSLSGHVLNAWGVLPRHLASLPGILAAPWLHADWLHLFNNLPGLLVLGWLVSLVSIRHFLQSSVFIILGSGGLVWLFARPGMHLGASGWLFGLWGLLLAQAWFQRSLGTFLIALLVLFFYGGWWFGLLPHDVVSFEYHLAGALCGVAYAALGSRMRR